jgi:hypothetical protein
LHLMARITVRPSIGNSTILLWEHLLGCAGLECYTTDDSWIDAKGRHVPLLWDQGDSS